MKIIKYVLNENETYYDFDSIRRLLNISKSKLQREIKKNGISTDNFIKYKNQHLYREDFFLVLLEKSFTKNIDKTNDKL